MNTEKYAISVREAAELMGVSLKTIYKFYHEDPTFPVIKLGRNSRVPRDLFLRWIEAKATERAEE